MFANIKTIILSFLLILILAVPAVTGAEDFGNDTVSDLNILGSDSAPVVLDDDDTEVCDSCDSCSCAAEFSSGDSLGEDVYPVGSHPLGLIPAPYPIADRSPVDISVLTLGDGVSIMADEPLPASYDLRDYDRMTPVKDQLDCGSCWAFASYGSMESVLTRADGDEFDFSENNMKNKHGFDWGCCDGGTAEMAIAYLTRWAVPESVSWYSGPVSESDDAYDNFSCVSPDSPEIQKHVQDVYLLPAQSPDDNSLVKSIIMDYGAVFAGFTVNRSKGFNMAGESPAYYYNSSEDMRIDGGHGIAIAGWDDSFSKDNFNVIPPGDGAYLIKNSWGTDWGNDSGYFYISYYDEGINNDIALFTAENKSNYDSVYYYDVLGATQYLSYNGTTTGIFANVFPSSGNETIRAAGVYTYEGGAEFEAEIHLNPDIGPENTTAGAVSAVNGTFDLPGYHTVDFDIPVEISEDDKFSVIFTVTNPSKNHVIPLEQKIANYSSAADSAPGESYFYDPNTLEWVDSYYELAEVNGPNVCIKAYTTEGHAVPAPVANFTAAPLTGKAPLTVQFNDTSENTPTKWLWSFGDGETSTVQNPQHTYNNAGNYTVSLNATNAGGSDSVTKTDYITVESQSGTEYEYIRYWGEFGQGDGQFWVPFSVAVDSAGYVYVADAGNDRVQKFESDGTFVSKWGSAGTGDGEFNETVGVAADSGDRIYVIDHANNRIQKFDSNGTFIRKWGSYGSGDGEFDDLSGIAVDSEDNVYVTDSGNSRVQKFDSDGIFITEWGSPGINDSEFVMPTGIVVDSGGNVYVTDSGSAYGNNVKKFTSDGEFVCKWGGSGDSNGKFKTPMGIAVDSEDRVFVADEGNDRVQIFTSNGGFLAKFGTSGENPGEFDSIFGLAFNSADDIFITEGIKCRIQVFSPNGTAPPEPAVEFTAVPTYGTAPLTVAFNDTSENTPTSWSWSFGDGNTSAVQNPTYLYNTAGSYNVSLTVTNGAGSDTITKVSLINVTAPAPAAEFDFNRNFVALIDDNTFSAGNYTSELTYLLHAANMDMGTTLGNLTYTAHAENLSWTEYSAYATRTNLTYVEWNFPSEYVIPGGSGFDTSAGTTFNEDNFYNHDFTRVCNATIFRTPGVQRTNITVTFNDLDFESIFVGFASAKDLNMTTGIINTSVVTDAPIAGSLLSGGDYHYKLDKAALTVGTEYYFRFDTDIVPNGSTVIHKPLVYVWEGMSHDSDDLGETYKAEVPAGMLPGDEYEFSVETNTSCDWSVTRQNNLLSVLEGSSLKPNGTLPSADFSATPLSGAAIRQVNFTDLSEGSPDTWVWDFGDGETSSEVNPVHNYTSSGKYSVTLAVSKDGATDSMTKTDYITVFIKGDFNGNGQVDIGDVSKVAYMVVGLTDIDMAADFNGDGDVDVADAAIIAWYFVGKLSEL